MAADRAVGGWVELRLTSSQADLRAVLEPAMALLCPAPASPLRRRVLLSDGRRGESRLRLWLGADSGDRAFEVAAAIVDHLTVPPAVSVDIARSDGPDIEVPFEGAVAAAFTVAAMDAMVPSLAEAWKLVVSKQATPFAVAVATLSAHLRAANTRAFETAPLGDATLPATFLSFRSHAEGFFVMTRDPVATRARFGQLYEDLRPAVKAAVAQALEGGTGAPDGPGDVGGLWSHYVRELRPSVESLVAGGDLRLPPGNGAYLGDSNDLAGSRFHQIVQDSPQFLHAMETDGRFVTGRVLTSMLYLFLHCLGLPLVERFLACYAVSRACEERSGTTAVDLLGQIARSGEAIGVDVRATTALR